MKKSWMLASGAALVLAACSGGSSPAETPTAGGGSPTAAPTARATRAAPPARPGALRDYGLAAASYLTAEPSAASSTPCLADLYAAWQMPQVSAERGCRAANVDGDPDPEVVAVFTAEAVSPGGLNGRQFDIVVLDKTPDGYKAAFETGPQEIVPPGGAQDIEPVLAAGDLIGDGGGALAYATWSCGASTCFESVHVVRGTASGYTSLTPTDGITMATVTSAKVEDTNGDGSKEIVLTGGEQGSVGAGPQRQRTEVWAWDGAAYSLRSKTDAPPTFLYHAVKDADALFAAARYAEAEATYLAVVGNGSLQVWNPDKDERNELEAYALFRAGLAELMAGGDRAKAMGLFDRADGYAGTLNHQLAGAFEAAYAAKGEVSVGCGAVREDVQANLAEYTQFWDFGYGNPAFDPDAVCPF